MFAGNLVAIGGLDDKVFKTATISDSPLCPSFTHSQFKVFIIYYPSSNQY